MIAAALVLALSLSAPEGQARVQDGERTTHLRLVSFDTEQVRLPRRGVLTSVEALFRSSEGDRLDLRLAFRGPGKVPADQVQTFRATARGRMTSVTGFDNGCRLVLSRATPDHVAGTATCGKPEAGPPVTISFEARARGKAPVQ